MWYPRGPIQIWDNTKGTMMYIYIYSIYRGGGVNRKQKKYIQKAFYRFFLGRVGGYQEDEGRVERMPGETERMTERRVRD